MKSAGRPGGTLAFSSWFANQKIGKKKSLTPAPDHVLAAMRETNRHFSDVVSTRNSGGLDRVYTAGATIMPPGADAITGRDAIKAFWQQAIEGLDVKTAQLETVSAEMVGDEIFEIGRGVLQTADGQQVTVKYVVRWKQEDGHWKWHVDIWNS
ncbi:MAG: nuclear transport factor 2 family protein [Bryobacteraceae bacterium]